MARLPIDYLDDARAEMRDVILWYRDRSGTAARGFVDELATAEKLIQSDPEAWSLYRDGTHRFLLRRYPYVIVYRVSERRIGIIAVAHTSRKPGYWKSRL
jgi:toxin ParE1/3/4